MVEKKEPFDFICNKCEHQFSIEGMKMHRMTHVNPPMLIVEIQCPNCSNKAECCAGDIDKIVKMIDDSRKGGMI